MHCAGSSSPLEQQNSAISLEKTFEKNELKCLKAIGSSFVAVDMVAAAAAVVELEQRERSPSRHVSI